MRALGWIIVVGGSLASVAAFTIHDMNPALERLRLGGVLASLLIGGLFLWLARSRKPRAD